MKNLFLVALVLVCSLITAAAQTISIDALSDNAYLLRANDYNTNIGVIRSENGIILIDPMPGLTNLLALETLITERFKHDKLFILNTHAHEDHTGGNSYFIERGAVELNSAAVSADISLLLLKSHSPADTVIMHSSSNSIFVGDIYDTSWHPTFYAGGLAGFVSAIDAILAVSDEKTLIIPGHGEHTGKRELQRYKENTLLWVERVKELNKAGKSVAQMIQDDQLNKILRTFNPNSSTELPERAVERFIERTLQVLERES